MTPKLDHCGSYGTEDYAALVVIDFLTIYYVSLMRVAFLVANKEKAVLLKRSELFSFQQGGMYAIELHAERNYKNLLKSSAGHDDFEKMVNFICDSTFTPASDDRILEYFAMMGDPISQSMV